jgi:hypothetical protein
LQALISDLEIKDNYFKNHSDRCKFCIKLREDKKTGKVVYQKLLKKILDNKIAISQDMLTINKILTTDISEGEDTSNKDL